MTDTITLFEDYKDLEKLMNLTYNDICDLDIDLDDYTYGFQSNYEYIIKDSDGSNRYKPSTPRYIKNILGDDINLSNFQHVEYRGKHYYFV